MNKRHKEADMNLLNLDTQIRIVNALVEGCSVRATARLVGVEHKTVLRVLLRVGDHCTQLLNERVRGVYARSIEIDEIWTYVFKKERKLTKEDDPAIMGDQYVFAAIGAEHKLIICHAIGKRDARTALGMIDDLKTRLINRPQLTTDGFTPYLSAVETVFGAEVDYAMLVKMYGSEKGEGEGPAWYGPAQVVEATPTVITGHPNPWRISTSYVERQNLTMRMMMRRFTRLTNGFSKKLENLRAAVALHFAHYNFCRIHSTLRVTPAMAAGISSEVWTLDKLLYRGQPA
jgi:IS1 family transposase